MTLEALYKIFLDSNGICTDSRKIVKGKMFFALKGDSFDGNQYAHEAVSQGCSFAIVDDPKINLNNQIIKVGDVLLTLQNLAQYHRKKWGKKIIAITGSNGKTTTKELAYEVLSKKFNTLATKGNLNNHIGVPLTLLNLKVEHNIAIVEMGANHVREINFLCEIAQPNFGLITNIGKAHIGEFGSFDAIVKTKKELHEYVLRHGGLMFVNSDDELLTSLLSDAALSYSDSEGNGMIKAELLPGNDQLTFKWNSNKSWEIKTKLIGDYNFYNTLAAITIGKYFEIEEEAIVDAIQNYSPKNNRSQLVESKKNKIVLDAYNANPSSTEAALRNLKSLVGEIKFAVLGDMLELGESEIDEHENIIRLVRDLGLQGIFIGRLFTKAAKKLPLNVFKNTEEAKDFLTRNPIENALVLLKGSRKMELEKLLDCF